MPAKEPTTLGRWLLDQMDRRQLSQTDLGAAVGVAQATISRWIYQDIQPEREKVMRLPGALDLDDSERGELSRITGFNLADAPRRPPVPAMHPLAAEIQGMLAAGSPIADQDREVLELLLDRVIEPYRKVMRRRRTA